MDIVNFLNTTFYRDSSYLVLTVLCLIWILADSKGSKRGKRMAVYAILCYLGIIWNPIVASYGVVFFGEDMYAYMRIFYLIPLMTILAYGATSFYTYCISPDDERRKKVIYMLLLVCTIMISGKTYGKSMYRDIHNIYKIDQDAYEMSNLIMEHQSEKRPVAWVPKTEDIWYGIRQYEGQIILEGDSDTLMDRTALYQAMREYEFEFVVFPKEADICAQISSKYFAEIGQTENYIIFQKIES